MNRRSIIVLAVLLILVIAAIVVYREYNRENADMINTDADAHVQASQLIAAFEKNDSVANLDYRNKILIVSGTVRSLDTSSDHHTIVLGDSSSMSSVRCLLDTKHIQTAEGLTIGTIVRIKGAITGFKKDELGIGSDVELNRCVVVRSLQN